MNFTDVIFLSLEKQQRLGYKILDFLPTDSYARKNIGYLYAIQHGAKIIYELDNENSPNSNEVFVLPEKSKTLTYAGNKAAVNVYKYFQQPNLWPRGFPLEEICSKIYEGYVLEREVHIPIQQGLMNGHPDVDIIHHLNVHFTKLSPIALTHVI